MDVAFVPDAAEGGASTAPPSVQVFHNRSCRRRVVAIATKRKFSPKKVIVCTCGGYVGKRQATVHVIGRPRTRRRDGIYVTRITLPGGTWVKSTDKGRDRAEFRLTAWLRSQGLLIEKNAQANPETP